MLVMLSAVQFGDTDAASQGTLSYNHSSNHMQFNTGAAERMRIDSSGRLLIGTYFMLQEVLLEANLEYK